MEIKKIIIFLIFFSILQFAHSIEFNNEFLELCKTDQEIFQLIQEMNPKLQKVIKNKSDSDEISVSYPNRYTRKIDEVTFTNKLLEIVKYTPINSDVFLFIEIFEIKYGDNSKKINIYLMKRNQTNNLGEPLKTLEAFYNAKTEKYSLEKYSIKNQ